MGVIRRRIFGVVVLGALVTLGLWGLQRDTQQRTAAQLQRQQDQRLLHCADLDALTEVRLRGPQGGWVLRHARGAEATTPAVATGAAQAREAAAGPNAGPTAQPAKAAADANAAVPGDARPADLAHVPDASAARGLSLADAAAHTASEAHAAATAHPTAPWQLWLADANVWVDADTSTVQATLQASCELAQLGNALALPAGTDLQPFGLAPPRHTLELHDADGTVQVLEVGTKSTFDGSLYVRRGKGGAAGTDSSEGEGPTRPVLRVDGAYAFQLERDAASLRDKRALRLEPREVVAIRVAPGDASVHDVAPYTLTREPNGFVLQTARGTQGADAAQAQALVAAVAQLRAQRFVAEVPDLAALRRFGLERPHLAVNVSAFDGTQHALRLGKLMLGEGVHYFIQAGPLDGPIAELPTAWAADKLANGARELRDMRVLDVSPDEVASFTVTEGHGPGARALRLARTGAEDVPLGRREFVATQLLPAGAAQDANAPPLDQQRVATTLARLCGMRADTFDDVPATEAHRHAEGVEPPALSVAFTAADGQELAVLRLGPPRANHRTAWTPKRDVLAHVFAAALEGVDARAANWQAAPDPTAP